MDLTNDLTFAMLEVLDEMSPILESKPNVRLHRGTPNALLDKVVAMIADSQGAPFLLNFDERPTVDSLLAIKHLIFDVKACTMAELVQALRDNWEGHAVLQARVLRKAPKYGRDDPAADAQYRPGMLSWNYWIADSFILPASPDGRPKGKFLSNALCPSNGADTQGPSVPARLH